MAKYPYRTIKRPGVVATQVVGDEQAWDAYIKKLGEEWFQSLSPAEQAEWLKKKEEQAERRKYLEQAIEQMRRRKRRRKGTEEGGGPLV